MKKSELLEAIKKVYEKKDDWRDPEFELALSKFKALSCKSKISLKITQMYEYVSFDFEIMAGISEIFKTRKINVGTVKSDGCETCDYGSSYEVTFSILDSPLEIDWEH